METLASLYGTGRLRAFQAVLTLWLAAFGLGLLVRSWHWPLVHDAPILMYMGFLTRHGMTLYKDVVEVQFPGSVMIYEFGQAVFGHSDFGFRMYDLAGLAVGLGCMLTITRRPHLWFAAVFGFAFFLWAHTGTSTSIGDMGQRDYFMTILLALGVACLFEAMRQERAWLMAGLGLGVGLGASIKPTCIFFVLLAVLVAVEMHKRHAAWLPYLAWTLAGGFGAGLVVVGYLVREHALGAFFALERSTMPLYSAIAGKTFMAMIPALTAPGHLLPALAVLALALALGQGWLRRDREQQILLGATVAGMLSYLLQHKGFVYHRTPFVFFFFLWVGWVLVATAAEGRRIPGWAAVAALTASSLGYPHLKQSDDWDDWGLIHMQQDLEAMHAADKPGEVQCFDVTDGCLTVVLRMQAVMATGYVTDYYFFLADKAPRLTVMRSEFLDKLRQTRPRLLLITNDQWPGFETRGYDKLALWPQFSSFLANDYRLAVERGGNAEHVRGYRIYERATP